MKFIRSYIGLAVLTAVVLLPALGQGRQAKKKPVKPEGEADYYKLLTFTPPPGEVLEAGAIEIMPDGKVAVGTRRGEIWMIDNAYDRDPERRRNSRASPTACTRCSAWRRRTAGSTSRSGPDVTRIKDTNGDGKADIFEVVTDGWEINGDYHEYAFGSRFDKNGNMWITLCLTGSFNSSSKFRGWAMKVTPEGKLIPDRQRRALAGRRRLQRRGRRLLHRQPGPVERRAARSSTSPWAASSAIRTASSGTRRRRPSTWASARRFPRAAAAS